MLARMWGNKRSTMSLMVRESMGKKNYNGSHTITTAKEIKHIALNIDTYSKYIHTFLGWIKRNLCFQMGSNIKKKKNLKEGEK